MAMVKQETGGKKKQTTATQTTKKAAAKSTAKSTTQSAKSAKSTQSAKTTTTTPAWDRTENPFPSVTTAKQLNTDYTTLQTARSNYKQAAQNVTDTRKAAQNEYVKLQSGQSTNELYKQTVLKALGAQSSFNQAEQTYNVTRQSFERKAGKYSGQYQNLLPGAAQSVLKQHSPETQRKKQQFSVAAQNTAYNSAQKDNENRIKQIDEEIAQLDGEIQTIQSNPSAYSSPEHSAIVQVEKDISAISDKQKLLKAEKNSLQADNSVINDLRRTLPFEKSLLADPQFSYYSNLGRIKTEREFEEQRDSSTTRGELNLINEPHNEIVVGMTDTQRSVYYYLLGKGDTEKAKNYKEQIQSYINSNIMQDYTEKIQKIAAEHPGAASLASLGTNLMNDFASPLIYANTILGNDIDVNSPIYRASQATKILRSADGEKVADKFGSTGEFLYNTGMSMADSAIARAIGVGLFGKTEAAAKVTSAIMGSGAAVESISSAKNRGVSDEKALVLGAIAGMAEYVTEKYSVETFFDETNLSTNKVKYLVQNVFSEGSEEINSDFINLFADILISKDKSEWEQSIVSYMAQGKSSSEAFGLAMKDQAAEMGLDFLGGAISGGVLAGGNLAINSAQNYAYDRALYKQAVQNGRAYFVANQGTKGALARAGDSKGSYMNLEQAYKTDPDVKAYADFLEEQKFRDEMEQLFKLIPGENEPSDSPAWQQYDAELARLEDEWGAAKIDAYFGLQSDSSQSQNNAQQNNPLAIEGADTAQYSIDPDSDSRGKQLTETQSDYFKKSLVRNAEGKLIPVYHGSSAQFNQFSHNYLGKNGSSEGRGFYFTDNQNMAEGYYRDGGQVLEGYLNITNPLSNSELTLTKPEVEKLIRAIDPTGDDILAGYDSSGIGYPSRSWYERVLRETVTALMSNESDSELLAEIANVCGDNEAVMRTTKDTLGYDGYIEKGKYDDATVYVAFTSDQFKRSDNQSPTSSEDIRYSISTKQASEVFTEEYLQRGKERVSAMDSVHSVSGIPFEPGKGLQDKVMEYLSKQGVVENPEIGIVSFSKSRIRNDISHGIGAAKAASYISVPSVIRNGFVVDYQPNWKNRGYATAVIAAPVTMNGENYLEGVIVTRTQDENKFYLHEVLTIKEDDASRSTAGVTKKATIPIWGDAPSLNSILKDVLSVNPSSKKYSMRRSRNDVDPATFGRRTMRSRFANNETRRTGILSGVDESIITQAEQLSQAFGTQVVFDDTLARSKQGCYLNGTITLNANLTEEQVVRRVFGHELTHSVERTAAYQELQSFVLSSIGNQTAVQNAINEKIVLYRTYGIDLDRTKAIGELTADFAAEHLFSNEQTVRRLATQHKSLATRILTWIRETLAKLTGNTEKAALLKAERLYANILSELRQSTESSEQYSIDPDFANEVEAWSRSGQQSGKQFILGSTGEVLQGLGAIESDIYMNSEKVTAILEKHPEMTLNEIKRLPEILDDPVIVLKSKGADRNGDNSRLILFGSVKAQNGRPVMSILDLRPVENRLVVDDMQKLTSAYTKTTKPAAFLQNGEVLYADEKRTTAILRHAGYSVTGKLLRSGSTGSISYADGNVNIQGTPFSQILQTEESTPQYSITPTADKTPAALEKENRRLIRENEKLEKENARLSHQLTRTQPNTPDAGKLSGVTNALLSGYASRMDSTTLYSELETLYRNRASGILKVGDVTIEYSEEQARADAKNLARKILEESAVKKDGQSFDMDTEVKNLTREILNRMEDVPESSPTFADRAAAHYAREHKKRVQAEETAKKERAENREKNAALKTAEQRGAEKERQRQLSQKLKENDRREHKKLTDDALEKVKWLRQNQNRAPADLKPIFDEILSTVNTVTKTALDPLGYSKRYGGTYTEIVEIHDKAVKDGQITPHKDIEMLKQRIDHQAIADMDVDALEDLVKLATALQTEVESRQKLLEFEHGMEIDEAAKECTREFDRSGNKPSATQAASAFSRYFNTEHLSPMNFILWMSGWNKNSTFYRLAKTLETGERNMRDYRVRTAALFEEFINNEENQEWLQRADGQGKDGIWYEVEIPVLEELSMDGNHVFGDAVKVSMTSMQKIHLSLECKNIDNLRHMQNGGRTFANRELYQKGQTQEAFAQGTTIRMTVEAAQKISSDLTAQEKAFADLLEQYYNDFAAQHINRVSNVLYGFDKAMSENYAPIVTNSNYNSTTFGIYDATAEGAGHLKERTHGGNPTLNIGAIDALNRHVDQTARFVGLAIPLRNWQCIMNWQPSTNGRGRGDSFRDRLTHRYGKQTLNYLEELLTTLEGGRQKGSGGVIDKAINTLLNKYVTATFGANVGIISAIIPRKPSAPPRGTAANATPARSQSTTTSPKRACSAFRVQRKPRAKPPKAAGRSRPKPSQPAPARPQPSRQPLPPTGLPVRPPKAG